jgi:hypothetical protein
MNEIGLEVDFANSNWTVEGMVVVVGILVLLLFDYLLASSLPILRK